MDLLHIWSMRMLIESWLWALFGLRSNRIFSMPCLVNLTYFQLLLLPCGDISFNPGPINGFHEHNYDQWAVFNIRALHFVHININSLLPKIEEFPYIAKQSEVKLQLLSFQNQN